jgi:hypothetical protein
MILVTESRTSDEESQERADPARAPSKNRVPIASAMLR